MFRVYTRFARARGKEAADLARRSQSVPEGSQAGAEDGQFPNLARGTRFGPDGPSCDFSSRCVHLPCRSALRALLGPARFPPLTWALAPTLPVIRLIGAYALFPFR